MHRYFPAIAAGYAILTVFLLNHLLSATGKDDQLLTLLHPIDDTSAAHTQQQQQQQHDTRPIFVLHVGPHKTGTTTIQVSFDLNPVLGMDNFTFLGFRNPKERDDANWQVRTLLARIHNNRTRDAAPAFFGKLKAEFSFNENVIISEENLSLMSKPFFTDLKHVLAGHRVIVLVGYRRYYEWIASVYNQIHKNKRHDELFVDWYRKRRRSEHVYSNIVYHEMKKHFDHVELINLHSPSTTDLMAYIYCDILPNAIQSCQWHKEQQRRRLDTIANPSVPTWPFAIAAQALSRGLTTATNTNNITLLSQEVKTFSTEINYSLPLKCISRMEQEAILKHSLQYEKQLLPEFFDSQDGETELRKGFSTFVDEGKFCSVDAARVLQSKEWRAFFSNSLPQLLPKIPKSEVSLTQKTTINVNAARKVKRGKGARKMRKKMLSDKWQFVICTRIRDEALYLREWIEYHRMIGFNAFLLMNDGSSDDTQCIVDDYAKEGIVIRIPTDIGFDAPKLNEDNIHAFDTCVDYLINHQDKFDPSTTWMLTHDVDEFVYINPVNNHTMIHDAVEYLYQLNNHARSLSVPRYIFGSSNHDYFKPDLVIDRFTRRWNRFKCKKKKATVASGRRRLFQQDQPRSYCNGGSHGQGTSYDLEKGFSLVSSMALSCYTQNKTTGQVKTSSYCSRPHTHTLVTSRHNETMKNLTVHRPKGDKGLHGEGERYMNMRHVGYTMVIMHYMVKSRQEFYNRVCSSVWSDKYFRCEKCTPEFYFNLTEEYANNFVDKRMARYSAPLKKRLKNSSIGTSCKTESNLHSLDHYRHCFDNIQKSLDKLGATL